MKGTRISLNSAWALKTIQGHTDRIQSVSVSADGQHAVSGGDDKKVKLWDITGGTFKKNLNKDWLSDNPEISPLPFEFGSTSVLCLCISPDGRTLLSGGLGNKIRMWKFPSGEDYKILGWHRSYVNALCISPDGKFALSSSSDGTIKLWDISTGKCVRTIKGHYKGVVAVCMSPDGRFALSGNWGNSLDLWELSSGRCLRTFLALPDSSNIHTAPDGVIPTVSSVCISPDGRFAVSGGVLKLWDLTSGECVRTFECNGLWSTCVCISPDGKFVISGNADNTIRIWEVSSGKCLKVLNGHTDWVSSVSLTADGKYLLSGSADKTLCLWWIIWDYEFPRCADWDENARPYLEHFLTLHTTYAAALPNDGDPAEDEIILALTRRGKPSWTNEDFQQLLLKLSFAGFGGLRPERVYAELRGMAHTWQCPPPYTNPGLKVFPINKYFPACKFNGPINPPVFFTHMGAKGFIPMKCSLCQYLFEGECIRENALKKDLYMHLDYGPCGLPGNTQPVEYTLPTYPPPYNRESELIYVPFKCSICSYLTTDFVHRVYCSFEREKWGDFHRGLDWGD